jgi:predicted nucleic acid-binding protein
MSQVLLELGEKIVVSPTVFEEVVSRPMGSKRFALGSMRINKLFDSKVISVRKPDSGLTKRVLECFNSAYLINKRPLKIIHQGEAEALALVREGDVEALLVDERTTRLLLEDPQQLRELLERQNNQTVELNLEQVNRVRGLLPKVSVIRSAEIAALAYERGILSKYMSRGEGNIIEAVLCALKFSGCAITWSEIEEYKSGLG